MNQVTVTLTFASIALAVAELSKLTSENVATVGIATAEQPKADKPKAEKPKADKPAATPAAAPTPPAVDKSPSGKEYSAVQAAVQKLAAVNASEAEEKDQTGRLAVKEVLAELGLTSFKGSPAAVWDDAIAKLTAKHVELTADA
jgi:hypothetical protein